MEKRLAVAVAFAAGICIVMLQMSLTPKVILAALALVSIGLAIGWRAVVPAAFLLGWVWGSMAAHHALAQRLVDADVDVPRIISGTIVGVPRRNARAVRFDFHLDSASSNQGQTISGRKVRLRWYDTSHVLHPGDQWQLKVRLRPPRGYRNQHGFDYEHYLLRNEISGTGYVLQGKRSADANQDGAKGIDFFRSSFRAALKASSNRLDNEGILMALAIGERSDLGSETRRLLRQSGLSHLVAISGLHIGLATVFAYGIAAGLWRIFPRGCQRIPARYTGWVIGITTGLGYSFVAGFPVSTIRAFIMVLIGAFLASSCTRTSPENLLAATMLLVALLWPLSASSPAFWLSFSAVWLMFRFLPDRLPAEQRNDPVGDEGRASIKARCFRYLFTLVKLQLILLAGMSPLLVYLFGEIPLSAPVTNLIAVPAFGFIVIPSVLTALGVYVAGFSGWVPGVLWPADQLVSGILWIAQSVSGFKVSVVKAGPVTGVILLLGLGMICIITSAGKRLAVPLLVVAVSWGGSLIADGRRLDDGEFNIAMLDVGQGLALVVTTRRHLLAYDFGPRYGEFSLGEAVVLPHLTGEGRSRIDAAVVSHGANDHAGGFRSVTDRVPIEQQFSGEPYETGGLDCARLTSPGWTWDGVSFTFLDGRPVKIRNVNDVSCVIRIQGKYGSALLTGDIEAAAEQTLVDRYGSALKVDVLQVPHHGSSTSSTAGFLKAASPQYALLSRGRGNRFGHPAAEVENRYSREQVSIWDTAKHGQIDLQSSANGWQIRTFLDAHARFWH
ncbi:MAG: DNA internalization-related competence protein ComEC/Rec2 [Arenicellales bacterium]|jgi:competence protein ComEC|nr:DNA internalization-related competence protein ComEC/Rec2 [Arenicellales bacterium]MDP6791776.1 DNA internalization-related competence protein ComEC/Rec2 [Arenicellales bacterium]MDP6918571.1 DNA internalization-related competence protein ComEC/Rec2 [Arenicellales bacterium]|tara:strand:+ start:23594 stop:25942 length:2349 start_codon:yes stop_codon:yes gene_type:complete